jgi:hypothetical protein
VNDAASTDPLFSDPDQALAGYDLTVEEVARLKAMKHAALDRAAGGSPEERKSFGVQVNHNEGTPGSHRRA